MRNILSVVFCLLLMTSCSKDMKILMAGSGWNDLALIDKDTKKIEWTYPLEEGMECNCIIMTKENNIAFTYARGVRLINKDKEVIWDYKQTVPGEIHSVTQLKNGNFILAISGKPASIVELSKDGKEIKRINFDGVNDGMHDQFRHICVSRSGNYLIPLWTTKEVIEIDNEGKKVNSYKVPASPFSVIEIENDNLIISGGDSHLFAEVDRKTGEIVDSVDQSSFSEDNMIHYVAEIRKLKNGNLMVCNWNGHFSKDDVRRIPHLVELDKDLNVKWRFDDFDNVPRVSSFYIVDNW